MNDAIALPPPTEAGESSTSAEPLNDPEAPDAVSAVVERLRTQHAERMRHRHQH